MLLNTLRAVDGVVARNLAVIRYVLFANAVKLPLVVMVDPPVPIAAVSVVLLPVFTTPRGAAQGVTLAGANGTENVVEPSPLPHVVPKKANASGYRVREITEDAATQPAGIAVPLVHGFISPISDSEYAAIRLELAEPIMLLPHIQC
jgi:hypothetical protein